MKNTIAVVAGFPRSGTTLVMNMIRAAGVPIVADTDTGTEADWTFTPLIPADEIGKCVGKAVKVLDPQINILPTGFSYRFFFMQRDYTEQAKSNIKFLRTVGIPGISNEKAAVYRLRDSFSLNSPVALRLLRSYPDSDVQVLRFEEVLADPKVTAALIAAHLRIDPDLQAMARVVQPRDAKCSPDMRIEMDMVL